MPDTTPRTTVNFGAYVEPDLAERMAELARLNDRTKSAELRMAMRAWLDRHDSQQEITPMANTNAN